MVQKKTHDNVWLLPRSPLYKLSSLVMSYAHTNNIVIYNQYRSLYSIVLTLSIVAAWQDFSGQILSRQKMVDDWVLPYYWAVEKVVSFHKFHWMTFLGTTIHLSVSISGVGVLKMFSVPYEYKLFAPPVLLSINYKIILCTI